MMGGGGGTGSIAWLYRRYLKRGLWEWYSTDYVGCLLQRLLENRAAIEFHGDIWVMPVASRTIGFG